MVSTQRGLDPSRRPFHFGRTSRPCGRSPKPSTNSSEMSLSSGSARTSRLPLPVFSAVRKRLTTTGTSRRRSVSISAL